ncbi:Uncharacterized protein ToN1_48420 [Aromatoleum petrolei]|nr:Uncharacterized protein ToN1_48420 [Aromatoleum petrolei]
MNCGRSGEITSEPTITNQGMPLARLTRTKVVPASRSSTPSTMDFK